MADDKKHYVMNADPGKFGIVGGEAKGTLTDAHLNKRQMTRERINFTHEKQSTNSAAWYALAQSFNRAAYVLEKYRDEIPMDTRPFAFNAALSLELVFKAVIASKSIPIPTNSDGHNLIALCEAAAIPCSADQLSTLELMTEELIWAGRYPTPNRSSKWDAFHDVVFEKHVVRSQLGNVTSVRVNPDTFPSWENYTKIWDLASLELKALK